MSNFTGSYANTSPYINNDDLVIQTIKDDVCQYNSEKEEEFSCDAYEFGSGDYIDCNIYTSDQITTTELYQEYSCVEDSHCNLESDGSCIGTTNCGEVYRVTSNFSDGYCYESGTNYCSLNSFSSAIGSHFICTLNDSEYLLDDYTDSSNNPYRAAFLDCEDECVDETSADEVKGFFDGNVNSTNGYLVPDDYNYYDQWGSLQTNTKKPRLINRGIEQTYGELGDYLGDSDLSQVR